MVTLWRWAMPYSESPGSHGVRAGAGAAAGGGGGGGRTGDRQALAGVDDAGEGQPVGRRGGRRW